MPRPSKRRAEFRSKGYPRFDVSWYPIVVTLREHEFALAESAARELLADLTDALKELGAAKKGGGK